MAFMGVFISWDIFDKNALFALFASCASSSAASNRCADDFRLSVISWISI
jgi:hypothetical protein